MLLFQNDSTELVSRHFLAEITRVKAAHLTHAVFTFVDLLCRVVTMTSYL